MTQSTGGNIGVIYADNWNILVCGGCGADGKLMAAISRGEAGKAYLWLVCATCDTNLTAISEAERLMQMIEMAKSGGGTT